MSTEELPKGWVSAQLDEVADVRLGRQRSPKNHTGDNMVPYLRAANVGWGGLQLDDIKEMHFTPAEVETYRLRPGDVVMSEASGSIGEVGKPAIWREQLPICCIQNTLIRVRPGDALDPSFLEHRLRLEALVQGWADGTARGVGIHHLGSTRLSSWRIALPPRTEQHRIVAELERRLSHVDAAERSLRIALIKSEAAERAVVAAAVSGRLVARSSTGAAIKAVLQELSATDLGNTALPGLPDEWAVVRLGDLAEMSLGKMLDAKAQTGAHPVEYLRNINVRWGRFDLADLATMDVKPAERPRVSAQYGDLIVCEGGEPGRCAVWTGKPMVLQKALHRVRPKSGISASYLALVLRWWTRNEGFSGFVTGSTIKHIPKERLQLLPVPLPSPAEQELIVVEAERRLSLLDAARRDMRAQLIRCSALRRSILAMAFRGELVPQDPAEEPAEELLARIRDEREKATPSKAVKQSVRTGVKAPRTKKEPAA